MKKEVANKALTLQPVPQTIVSFRDAQGKQDGLDDRLRRASQSYHEKGSCTQAVLDSFTDENAQLSEQCPSDLCGVLHAAEIILRRSSQALDSTFGLIINRFHTEYGGITCQEMMHDLDPDSRCCCMKVKDAVLLIHRELEHIDGEAL